MPLGEIQNNVDFKMIKESLKSILYIIYILPLNYPLYLMGGLPSA